MIKRLVTLSIIILLLFALVMATRYGISNIYFFKAERAIEHWGYKNRNPQPDQIRHATTLINKAISYWRKNPDYLVLRAQISGWDAFVSDKVDLYRPGISDLRLALETRPAHTQSWALLAEFKTAVGEKDAEWRTARKKVLQFGSHDIRLIKRMESLN